MAPRAYEKVNEALLRTNVGKVLRPLKIVSRRRIGDSITMTAGVAAGWMGMTFTSQTKTENELLPCATMDAYASTARDEVVAGAEDERWQRIRFAFPR